MAAATGELQGDERFDQLGLDSMMAGHAVAALNAEFGLALQPTVFYNHPSVDALTAHVQRLLRETPARAVPAAAAPAAAAVADDAVAVVGMSGRFAGAPDLDRFWRNLAGGVDSVAEIDPARWDVQAVYDPRPQQPGRSNSQWMGALEDVDQFDAPFFGLTSNEAVGMDPQQRIALEQSWLAMEHAGYSPQGLAAKRCGVFFGAMTGDYMELLRAGGQGENADAMLGNHSAVLSGRIAYLLDLRGPALTLDTACSSSLLAVHLARRSLLAGECDMAMAGGVFVTNTPLVQVMSSAANMLSPDGRCKTFDNKADGIVVGEGCGVVVLKRLRDALADGDTIHGVIRASGSNQDGRTHGLTAPNGNSQAELEEAVYRGAGISARSIDYVEAHGTGTKLGDPVEVEGLTQAFRKFTDERGFCALGSVKPNIGHCYAAAGIASLLKTLLALAHRQLPPSIHCDEENEHIRFAETPFVVNRTLRDWVPQAGAPRRAAVSAFGYSGTNVHLVVDEAPVRSAPPAHEPPEAARWLLLSARDRAGLRQAAAALHAALPAVTGSDGAWRLADVAYTLQTGRRAHDVRVAIHAAQPEQALAALRACADGAEAGTGWRSGEVLRRRDRPDARRIAEAPDIAARVELWLLGAEVDWAASYAAADMQRVPLPGVAFARKRHWPKPAAAPPAATASADREPPARATERRPAAAPSLPRALSLESARQSFHRNTGGERIHAAPTPSSWR